MPPEKLDPGDDDSGTPHHHIERFERLPPTVPLDPLYQELQVGLDGTEIDVLRIPARHDGVVIVWHIGSRQSRGFAAKHGDVMPHYG